MSASQPELADSSEGGWSDDLVDSEEELEWKEGRFVTTTFRKRLFRLLLGVVTLRPQSACREGNNEARMGDVMTQVLARHARFALRLM